MVRKMHSFNYGTRVIENEQQVRFERNVKRLGNLLHWIARLFVTFFLFVLINLLLSSLVQHVNLTFIKMLNLVQESAEVLFSQSAMSATTTFISQHSFCWMFAVAFFCASLLGSVLFKVLGECKGSSESAKESYSKNNQEFCDKTCETTVSYKQKVCFLS